ncbi:MAG: MoxR family ATPase [Methylococcales bacterium]|jgi:MoxR-like ATPase|nr:MoxR family ATPase [Methylococcales bacterium]MBT7444331.1 MoxR family ATPase [Methylococcales bacterium]
MNEPIENILKQVSQIILGKDEIIKLALTALLAKGHILLEDVPGVGKTTFALTLAKVLGLDYQRVQFTSDMLPADILGVSIFNQNAHKFEFHPGPIFSNIVLADEVNRATPKAQSALLEAMEEGQVTLDGETRALPDPFFVIATQNPTDQIGTFPLPESQLERFLMCLYMGYPDSNAERALLKGEDRRHLLKSVEPAVTHDELLQLQAQVGQIHASDALLDYVQNLIHFTRNQPEFLFGLSPRSGLALLRAAKSWAFIHGRKEVLPEDVQSVLPAVTRHRLFASSAGHASNIENLPQFLLSEVAVP